MKITEDARVGGGLGRKFRRYMKEPPTVKVGTGYGKKLANIVLYPGGVYLGFSFLLDGGPRNGVFVAGAVMLVIDILSWHVFSKKMPFLKSCFAVLDRPAKIICENGALNLLFMLVASTIIWCPPSVVFLMGASEGVFVAFLFAGVFTQVRLISDFYLYAE